MWLFFQYCSGIKLCEEVLDLTSFFFTFLYPFRSSLMSAVVVITNWPIRYKLLSIDAVSEGYRAINVSLSCFLYNFHVISSSNNLFDRRWLHRFILTKLWCNFIFYARQWKQAYIPTFYDHNLLDSASGFFFKRRFY